MSQKGYEVAPDRHHFAAAWFFGPFQACERLTQASILAGTESTFASAFMMQQFNQTNKMKWVIYCSWQVRSPESYAHNNSYSLPVEFQLGEKISFREAVISIQILPKPLVYTHIIEWRLLVVLRLGTINHIGPHILTHCKLILLWWGVHQGDLSNVLWCIHRLGLTVEEVLGFSIWAPEAELCI